MRIFYYGQVNGLEFFRYGNRISDKFILRRVVVPQRNKGFYRRFVGTEHASRKHRSGIGNAYPQRHRVADEFGVRNGYRSLQGSYRGYIRTECG